jgi:hypothetical protein
MSTKLLYLSPLIAAAAIGLLAGAGSAIEAAAQSGALQAGSGLLVLLTAYFLPAIAAGIRRHHNSGAIFAANLLLGWTMLGWVVALIWALTNPAPSRS